MRTRGWMNLANAAMTGRRPSYETAVMRGRRRIYDAATDQGAEAAMPGAAVVASVAS